MLGVGDDSYTVYESDARLIEENKEKILMAELKHIKWIGSSRQTLFDIKRAIKSGAAISRLKPKTMQRLIRFMASLV